MRTTICRTVIICVVWFSVSTFLTFGLPSLRVNSGDALPLYVAVVFIGIAGAVAVTPVIWLAGRPKKRQHGFEVIQRVELADEAA